MGALPNPKLHLGVLAAKSRSLQPIWHFLRSIWNFCAHFRIWTKHSRNGRNICDLRTTIAVLNVSFWIHPLRMAIARIIWRFERKDSKFSARIENLTDKFTFLTSDL